jgi:beta-xylosidase
MKKYLGTVLFLMGVSFACSSGSVERIEPENQAKLTFTNPVWNGADPWMVKQNDEYIYCYSANNSIVLSRSKYMTRLGAGKTIWTAPDTGWNSNCIWAPEVHLIDGHWYVYYAAGVSGPLFFTSAPGYCVHKLTIRLAVTKTWGCFTQAIIRLSRKAMCGLLI